ETFHDIFGNQECSIIVHYVHPNRYFVPANSYSGRHTSRFNPTTKMLMSPTPRTMRGQSPFAVASEMYAPSPSARRLVLPQETNSETMLAFHAPPEAVIAPVTHEAKMPGPMSARHSRLRRRPMLAAISRRSFGIPCAPPITLNRRYHCAPNAIRSMLPQFKLSPNLMNPRVAKGNKKFAGNDAKIWTIGCETRASFGLNPIA